MNSVLVAQLSRQKQCACYNKMLLWLKSVYVHILYFVWSQLLARRRLVRIGFWLPAPDII